MGRKREGRCCAPFVSEQFSCFSSPIATAHEQHTPGRGPGSEAISPLPQSVAFLPAAASECDTRLILRTDMTTATSEEARL